MFFSQHVTVQYVPEQALKDRLNGFRVLFLLNILCAVFRNGFQGSHQHILWHTRVFSSRGFDRNVVHPRCGLVGAGRPHLRDAGWGGECMFH